MISFASNSPWPRRLRNLLIAIGVLVALQSIAAHFVKRWVDNNGGEMVYRTSVKLKGISAGLTSHHFIKGKYPANAEAFKLLFDPPPDHKKFHLPRFSTEVRHLDAWQREFRYLCPGKHNAESYDLWSVGPDGEDGTNDDITNW